MTIKHVTNRSYRIVVLLMLLGTLLSLLPGLAAAQGANAAPADEWPEWRGTVESMPAGGLIGTWQVGGRTFTADAGTKFEQEHGALQVGACAEVKYQTVGAGYRAVEINSTESYKCGGSGGSGGGGGGEQESKVYGRIDTMPASGLIGSWTIGGVTYTADASTYFEQEHGGFAPGVCVEVDYRAGTPPIATKISTENDYKCGGSGGSGGGGGVTNPYGEMYGVISSFPAGLIGQWVIGGMTFTADNTTVFQQEHGAFAVGVMVDVKFYTDAAGVNHATKIESKYGTDSGGHDDDGNGSYEGYEGHAYGTVSAMPAGGMIGTWTIAGIQYTVNAATRIEQEHGAITVGSNVKVKYYLDASNNRVARKIESTYENGGVSDPSHYKLYGFVEQMPGANTFNGQWVVNGVAFTGDQRTQFVESHGLLAVGAYVEVEYTQNNGVNWMTKIETHVPPGAGPEQHVGTIDSNVGAAGLTANATWVIGGKSFVVTPATDLNDLNGALTVGSTAIVNAYTDANGASVATQIKGVTFTSHVYLPVAIR